MLKLKNINYSYVDNDTLTLSNISLSVENGEKIGLIGESGSGKSSLLKLIKGYFDYNGTIELNGNLLKKRSDALIVKNQEIKYIDQLYDLKKNQTVLENLESELRGCSNQFQKRRIKTLVSEFKLDKIIHKQTDSISGGEMQRLAIAVALAQIPSVLLLDEPFNNLDYLFRKKIISFIESEIQKYKITAILVSHIPEEILHFSNNIVVMKGGKIIQKGLPTTIYFHPKTKYTASLLGPFELTNECTNCNHTLNKQFFKRLNPII